jgi:dTMP kinase
VGVTVELVEHSLDAIARLADRVASRPDTVAMFMTRGRLITIEGIDGTGKTTLAGALEAKLRDRGLEVRLLREPGGVPAAERVRELVTDPALSIAPRAEALLYAAARAQLVEEAIAPLLDRGTWVLLDRFVDSSLAYQGAGRGLGLEAVRAINDFGTGGLLPDRTLLLVLDPEVARSRSRSRGEPADRMEQEQREFFEKIAQAYAQLAAGDPGRIATIEAGGSPAQVLAAAWGALADLL